MNASDTNKNRIKASLGRWWVGCVAGFLLLCKHLTMYTSEQTRYDAFWGTGDAVAFALDVVLLGTLLFVIYELALMTNVAWVRRVGDAFFVMLVGLCLVGYPRTGFRDAAWPWLPGLCTALTCVIVASGAMIVLRRESALPRHVRNVCLIFSPVVPIVLVQLFFYPQHSITNEVMPEGHAAPDVDIARGDSAARDVYVVIFDEWSYSRTFPDGHIRDDLPNLQRFAHNATVYSDAHSPYPMTMRSLPGILFQTRDEYQNRAGRLGFERSDAGFDDMEKRNSLFTAGRSNGYRTFMIGTTHPYRRWFGEELDYCYTCTAIGGNPDDRMLGRSMLRHLLQGVAGSTGAVPKPAALEWRLDRFWQQVCQLTASTRAPKNLASIHQRALSVIRDQPSPVLSVVHYPLPHSPYIFSRDGVDLEANKNMPLVYTPKGDGTYVLPESRFIVGRYLGNIRYMDTLLGELVAELKSAGKYDDALIILTSDHNWNSDPAFVGKRNDQISTHVPLLVKHPRQTTAEGTQLPFSLTNLHELIFTSEQLVRMDRPSDGA